MLGTATAPIIEDLRDQFIERAFYLWMEEKGFEILTKSDTKKDGIGV
jgi:hypothetical protein